MAFLAVCDGHGGRDIVEFLEDGLLYHVSSEMQFEEHDSSNCDDRNASSGHDNNNNNNNSQTNPSNDSISARLERAFLMADIHSKAMGLTNSGATVAVCVVTRGNNMYDDTAFTTNQKIIRAIKRVV